MRVGERREGGEGEGGGLGRWEHFAGGKKRKEKKKKRYLAGNPVVCLLPARIAPLARVVSGNGSRGGILPCNPKEN